MVRSVSVFCGSSAGNSPQYLASARETGALLARRNLAIVYGGGRVGLMGALAEAALAEGGRVIGVMPQMLIDQEVGHAGLSQLHVVASLSERKVMMNELADAFLALPGGIGTMDELFEAWTWTQLSVQHKPCALLNQGGYYDALIAFLDHAVSEGFLRPRHRAALLIGSEIGPLLEQLERRA